MSTASAVNRAIVDSNIPTTAAARNAVTRLISSHGSRLRTANITGESARSCRLAPTIACMSDAASSCAVDASVSWRITPMSRPSKSTTGRLVRRRSVKRSTTSSWVATASTQTGVVARLSSGSSSSATASTCSGTAPSSCPSSSVRNTSTTRR